MESLNKDVEIRAKEVQSNLMTIDPELAREAMFMAIHNFRMHAGLPLEDHNGPLPLGELLCCLILQAYSAMGYEKASEYIKLLQGLVPCN